MYLSDIGIITPYKEQRDRLKERISQEIQADTIHSHQGREKEIMILSTTAN